jgi:excisionase family DNA binding protein
MEPLYIDKKDAAVMLGVSVAFLNKKIMLNEIPFYRIGDRVRFRIEELTAWMDSRKNERLAKSWVTGRKAG